MGTTTTTRGNRNRSRASRAAERAAQDAAKLAEQPAQPEQDTTGDLADSILSGDVSFEDAAAAILADSTDSSPAEAEVQDDQPAEAEVQDDQPASSEAADEQPPDEPQPQPEPTATGEIEVRPRPYYFGSITVDGERIACPHTAYGHETEKLAKACVRKMAAERGVKLELAN